MKSAIMRGISYTIIGLLFCIQLPTLAQDATPISAPWPPDTTLIFEPGTEVVENPPYVPINVTDNEKRLISIDNKDTGKIDQYPYPETFKNVYSASSLSDGKLWFQVDEVSGSRWVWNFDTKTKSFTRYIARCGQKEPLIISEIKDDAWVLYEDAQSNRVYLCEAASGKKSEPLPADMTWLINTPYFESYIQPSTSPDGQWLALFATKKNPSNHQVFVYSYNVLTKELKQLGDFQNDELIDFYGWFGTQIVVYTNRMSESSMRTLYIADAAKSQSLEYATSRAESLPGYYDNPSRFEYIGGGRASNSPYGCWWEVYTIATRQTVTHNLGSMCEPEIGKLTEDAYYRDVPDSTDGRPATATLVRFNTLTGQRKDLYSGEIESIEWVSQDEHFAIMTLGTNGVIDNTHDISDPSFLNLDTSANLSYVDLVNKQVLFAVHAYWENYWNGGSLKSSIRQLDQNTFLAIGYTEEQDGLAALYTFDGKNYVEKQRINNVAEDKGHFLLVWTDGYQKSSRMSIYDVKTGHSIPVIRNVDPQA